jgi:hypothetical protein
MRATGAPQRADDAIRTTTGSGPAVIAVAEAGDAPGVDVAGVLAGLLFEMRGGDVAQAELDLLTGALVPGSVDTVGVIPAASLPHAVAVIEDVAAAADVVVVGLRGPLAAEGCERVLALVDQAVLVARPARVTPGEVASAGADLAAHEGPSPVLLVMGEGEAPSRDTLGAYERALPGLRALVPASGRLGEAGARPSWARDLAAVLVADWPALDIGRHGAAVEDG